MLPRHPHPKRPQSASPASCRGKLRVPGHNWARHRDDVGVWISAGEYMFRSWQVKQKRLVQTWIIWGVEMEHGGALAPIFSLLPIASNNGTAWFNLFSALYLGAAQQWEWVLWEADLVSQADMVEEAHTVQLDLTMRKEAEAQGGGRLAHGHTSSGPS